MKRWHGIGMMSGTSLDGVDLAYCEFSLDDGEWSYRLLRAETIPLSEKWKARLAHLDQVDARTYARTHVYWGRELGLMARFFISRYGLDPQFVACHGQTIFHEPDKNYTAQIGDGETMVAFLNCPLVTNLRNKDVALGGQGAPLVPFGERMLWPEAKWFLNLGGIANLSRISANGDSLAYDVTAANMALNWLARNLDPPRYFDRDGEVAASGSLDPELLARLNGLPYFDAPPPKSLGTEWFEAAVLPLLRDDSIPVADRMHTYVHHLTGQVARDMERFGAQGGALLVTGGGAHNTFLMQELRTALSPLGVEVPHLEAEVIDQKEAIVFAFLGLQVLLGQTNTLAGVTGASQTVTGGSIHLPPGGGPALL